MSLQYLFRQNQELVKTYTTTKQVDVIEISKVILNQHTGEPVLVTSTGLEIIGTFDQLPVNLTDTLVNKIEPCELSEDTIGWDYNFMIVRYSNGYISTCPVNEFLQYATEVQNEIK